MTKSHLLQVWLPQLAESAAAKLNPATGQLSTPLTQYEKFAIAVMADCDIDEHHTEAGIAYSPRHPIAITVVNGRFEVQECPEFKEAL